MTRNRVNYGGGVIQRLYTNKVKRMIVKHNRMKRIKEQTMNDTQKFKSRYQRKRN